MPVTIRPYEPGDAQRITALYNRHPDNPNPVSGGITAQDLERELADRRTAAFFVAVDGEDVVGTLGTFQLTGRRCARAGELIADMFFMAPSHRGGMLTGQLFATAMTWMYEAGYLVLRLTVNPANPAAFRLYRGVGCVGLGAPVPGEDGNVELYNHIPLILRSVLSDLDERTVAALGSLPSFARLTDDRGENLRSDLELVDGRRTAPYRLVLGDLLLSATVDVDAGAVLTAGLTGPDGTTRQLAVVAPGPDVRACPDTRTYRFGSPDLGCEVDGRDGTVRLVTPRHLGPVLTSTWPSCHPDRVAGWRDAIESDLEVTEIPEGVRVTERYQDVELVGTITLTGGRLRQEFASTAEVGRVLTTVGLRQGTLELREGTAGAVQRHPAGLGLGVRDASEVPAAAYRPGPGSELAWTSADGAVRVSVPVTTPTGLVHGCLLDRRPHPDSGGAARWDTWVSVQGASPAGSASGVDVVPSAGVVPGEDTVRMTPAAGGVTAWTHGRTRVLRSPHPRRRVLACNPTWSAGMWVTTERSRYDRGGGPGWGLAPDTSWEPKHPLGIHAPDLRISWEVSLPDGRRPDGWLTVDLHHPDATGEVVLWVTPRTGRAGRVVVPAPDGVPGGVWELAGSRAWQRWTSSASIELGDGRWLVSGPGPDAPDDAELVLRSTSAGLLIGCVTEAAPPHAAGTTRTTSSWRFAVRSTPVTWR